MIFASGGPGAALRSPAPTKGPTVTPPRTRPLWGALAAWGLGLAAVAAAPDAASPPPPSGLSPAALAEARLRGADATLDDLDALLREAAERLATETDRDAPPPPAADALERLAEETEQRRQTLKRLADRLEAGDAAEVAREARDVSRWAREAARPLDDWRRARRQFDLGRAHDEAEAAWARLKGLDHGDHNPLLSEAGRWRRQADAALADGDPGEAADLFRRLAARCVELERQAGERHDARAARAAAACVRRAAERGPGAGHAGEEWQRAEELANAAEEHFAHMRFVAAREAWQQAARGYELAAAEGARRALLAQARSAYLAATGGVSSDDLGGLGPAADAVRRLLAVAGDERGAAEERADAYRQATALARGPVAALRLRQARARLDRDDVDGGLDLLAAALAAAPDLAEARSLFDDLVRRHPDWWVDRARRECDAVADAASRLGLFVLLARTRRRTGDEKGLARAVDAAFDLIREEAVETGLVPPVEDVLRLCQDLDGDAARRLADAVGEASGEVNDKGERALWQAWRAGVLGAAGDADGALRARAEAESLAPGRGPFLRVGEAVASGRPADALARWQEATRPGPEALPPADAGVCGAWALKLAAERGDEAAFATLREGLLALAEDKFDEAGRATLLREVALADALRGDEADARALLDGTDGAARACWLMAEALARRSPGEAAAWAAGRPGPVGRCAAFLGAAAWLGRKE
jgi:hypothetical protein